MPELPEVEHVRRNLQRWMAGASIVDVVTDDARIVRPATPSSFVRGLRGRRVREIARRGKWIRCLLDDDRRLFVHLGMTGWFEHESIPDPSNPHPSAGHHLRFERARFVVKKGRQTIGVVFVDPRRWGRLVLADDDIAGWKELGPDPLDDGIELEALEAKLARGSRRSIKEALMDQTVLAGIGNIQAIESLWKAGIDPRSRASAISHVELARIAQGIRWTIERTLADLAKGEDGAESPFRIYGHKGEPCPRCKTTLRRVTLGGRTTTFCPGCQKRKR